MTHRLFDDLAHRYDLHTPPAHYRHDHAWVLGLTREFGPSCRLLDIGCGTGVFIQKARRNGIDAHGIDVAAGMVQVARKRLSPEIVSLLAMEDLDDDESWHVLTAMSWTLNYCADAASLSSVAERCYRALLPGGRMVAQVAHAENASGDWCEDRELGPKGQRNDVALRYRFRAIVGNPLRMWADYRYRCVSAGEQAEETHELHVADAHVVSRTLAAAGFIDVGVYNSFRMDAFHDSVSAWVVARRPTS